MDAPKIFGSAKGDAHSRTLLWRRWAAGNKSALWIMLNPSSADGATNDPTLYRCIALSRRLGFSSLRVVNWWTKRTPSPRELSRCWAGMVDEDQRHDFLHAQQIIEREIEFCLAKDGIIIAAWGNPPTQDMADWIEGGVEQLREADTPLHHLGLTKLGHPKHPLARGIHRIPDDQPLIRWEG